MRLTKFLTAAIAAGAALCAASAIAAVGDVNPAFGTNGVAMPVNYGATEIIFATPDGKFIYGGSDSAVYRLLANGSPDTSFASSGMYPQGSNYGYGGFSQLALFVDGSFDEYRGGTNEVASVSAHDATGALISGFGTGGVVEASSTGQPPSAAPIPQDPQTAIQAGTGRLVVIGPTNTFNGGPVQIAGFNSTGFDPSFPAGKLDVGQKVILVSGIVPELDGSFLVYGTAALNASTGDSALAAAAFVAKITAQGQLDTSFGNQGSLTFPDYFAQSCNEATENSFVLAVTPHANWRFDVLYQDISPDTHACGTEKDHVFQYLANGTLDTTFGNQGDVYLGDGHSAQGMVLEVDGKPLLSVFTPSGLTLVRYTDTGAPDASFGSNGVVAEPSGTAPKLLLQTGTGLLLMQGSDIHENATLSEIEVPTFDVAPTAFSFTAITGATPGSLQTSNAVTIAGLGTGVAVPAEVVGGLLSVNGGPFAMASDWVQNGDTLAVQGAAPAAAGATVSFAVSVGGVLGNASSPEAVTGSPFKTSFQVSSSATAPSAPTVTLSASPVIVTEGNPVTLNWSSNNATACTATGAWAGAQTVSGSKVVTPATTGPVTYGLTCSAAGESGAASASVDVQAGSSSSSGGSSSSSSSSSGGGSSGGGSSSSSSGGSSSGAASSSSGVSGGSSSGGSSGSGGGGGGSMDVVALLGMLVAALRRRSIENRK